MPRIQPAFQPNVLYKSGNLRCQYTPTTCPKCLDINNSTLSSSSHNYTHMPGRNSTVYWSKETHPHITTTHCLQCYITQFSPTPTLWRTTLEVNISLDMANLNMINILSVNFHIWQHLEKHQNESQLQHVDSIPSIPVGQLYSHMAKGIQHITPFLPEESTGDTDSIWTLFLYTGVYVMAIGLPKPTGLGINECRLLILFWFSIRKLNFSKTE